MKTLLIAAAAFASITGSALANSDQFDQRGGIQVLEQNYGQASASFDYTPTASIAVPTSLGRDLFDQRGGTQVLEENYVAASSAQFDYTPTASVITDTNPLIETEAERRFNR